jgi:hypothetical protein
MGRKKEFVASKSFTLGLQELLYMEKKCNEQKIKASKFINRLLRKAMLADQKKAEEHHGPITYCTTCSNHREFRDVTIKGKIAWLCKDCGDDKTQVIKYMLETS